MYRGNVEMINWPRINTNQLPYLIWIIWVNDYCFLLNNVRHMISFDHIIGMLEYALNEKRYIVAKIEVVEISFLNSGDTY
jgi:hypothetical protein